MFALLIHDLVSLLCERPCLLTRATIPCLSAGAELSHCSESVFGEPRWRVHPVTTFRIPFCRFD